MAARADVTLTIGGDTVGTLAGARVATETAMLAAAAETDYGVARVVPGVSRWSVSGAVFVPAPDASDQADAGQEALRGALLGLTTVAVVVTHTDATTESGTAIVTAWDVTGRIAGAVQGSFQLQGTGALS